MQEVCCLEKLQALGEPLVLFAGGLEEPSVLLVGLEEPSVLLHDL